VRTEPSGQAVQVGNGREQQSGQKIKEEPMNEKTPNRAKKKNRKRPR
jgi:hypothetical protein